MRWYYLELYVEDTFCNLSSSDLEFIPLMFHYGALFLTCVLVVLNPVISLMHLQLSFILAPTDGSRPTCSLSRLASDTASSGDHFVGLGLGISVIPISLPISAVILLFSLKTLRSLSDGILGLDKVLIKSKLD